ncbi:hypothetical protein SK128_020475 [Halocaridina rubra]|uniref:C-type lectin domain-containing protein n=1 Tax=Halocaridina rubra TaxID=373956 RepID=A0AAN8WDD6_HALRR
MSVCKCVFPVLAVVAAIVETYPTSTRTPTSTRSPSISSTTWFPPATINAATTTTAPSTITTIAPPQKDCAVPFKDIGGRCLFINPFTKGNWMEMRYFCHELLSELAVINEGNVFTELLNFTRFEGIDQHDYWIGANDTETEGDWRWVNHKKVVLGSPYWALYGNFDVYVLEPQGGYTENCLYLDSSRFLYFDDGDCSQEKAVICEYRNSIE